MDKIKLTKQRDYKVEYQRRRELAKRARIIHCSGKRTCVHWKSRFLNWKRSGFVDRTRKSTVERFYQAINGIASGKSLTKAAKDAHTSIATRPFHWPVNWIGHFYQTTSEKKS